MTATPLLLGATAASGAWLIWRWWLARTPTLEARIAPRLRAGSAVEHEALTPFPTLERLLAPVLRDVVRRVEGWVGGRAALAVRLRRAGGGVSVERFRAEQVLWAVGGLAVGIVFALGLSARPDAGFLPLAMLALACAAAGAAARDYALGRAVRRREQRVLAELPTVAEMMALAVNAGEGAQGAIERVSTITAGALADDLRGLVGRVHAGASLPVALRDLAAETGVAPLRRFGDAVAVAIERGTPLADVLAAQAQDVRDSGRRALMEDGGKREIAMMVPVIFLILPVTVVFAIFPGIVAIRLGV